MRTNEPLALRIQNSRRVGDDDDYRKGAGEVPKTRVIRAALSESSVSLSDPRVWTQHCATGQQG